MLIPDIQRFIPNMLKIDTKLNLMNRASGCVVAAGLGSVQSLSIVGLCISISHIRLQIANCKLSFDLEPG